MKASEQRKLARVATELAGVTESFKGYLAQTGNSQFKYVWFLYFLISDNLTIPSSPSKVFFCIKSHIVQGANEVTVKDNIIDGPGYGAGVEMAQNSSNFLIENNTISNVSKGIAVSAHSDTFNIKNNTINYVLYGIQTYQIWNGSISNNEITQPENVVQGNPAIAIEQSNGVVVTDNQITGDFYKDNQEKAIFVYGSYPTNSKRLLFAGGTDQAREEIGSGMMDTNSPKGSEESIGASSYFGTSPAPGGGQGK